MEEPRFQGALEGLAARVARQIGDAAVAGRVLRQVRDRAPDEGLALAFLLRLGESSRDALRHALRSPECAGDLVFCLGASELIASGLATSGDGWLDLFEQARGLGEGPTRFSASIATVRELAAQHQRAMLAIAIGDVLGLFSVRETVTAMSHLADDCVRAALALAARELNAEAVAQRFCVLGMGKLGGRELNLSSDIDLIYLFDDGDDPGDAQTARRLGERLTEILANHCFRVDLRLRPGGRSAPLVSSVEGAVGFYQDYGETWERAALLRARPVAGAIMVGQGLIAELARFVYRVYLDFETIGQLRAMKRQIEDELRSFDLIDRNIKLGHGGIRELEFIVQALVLIYGGRDRRLRASNTMETLARLASYGYIPEARASDLRAAYLLLRNVEHKLQIAAGLQTHTLPADSAALAVLAARLGYGKTPEAVDRFRAELARRREQVAEQFNQMLSGDDDARGGGAAPALAQAAWRVALEPEWSAPALKELGFADPTRAARGLQLLARGPEHLPPSQRRRESLERLGPILLDEIRQLPDPDLALGNIAAFIAAVGARTSFLALLEQHPATRRVLLRLFASSAYLSELFIRHPEMIDTLVRSDLARPRRTSDELAAELHELVAACGDVEEQLDALRGFRHQEFLRIAIADLAGELRFSEVQAELTGLAETVLREALEMAIAQAGRGHPVPVGLKVCVLAMGRLGAAEMTYNSDLDLIFVYFMPGETATSGREAASRVAQKLIAILEAPTREGYAYKIDLRLRPSGNAGPLVASLEGFHQYHRESSALWERQALVRARVVAGDRALGDEVEAARRKFVFDRGLDRQGVAEIADMRARIERELGHESPERLNLKQGPGGLVDVEFLAQLMALRYGGSHPELRQRSTLSLLDAIGQQSLMPAAEVEQLKDDYRFLAQLENRLRIESDRAVAALPTTPAELAPVARRAGYDGALAAEDLLRELTHRRARVRAIYEKRIVHEESR